MSRATGKDPVEVRKDIGRNRYFSAEQVTVSGCCFLEFSLLKFTLQSKKGTRSPARTLASLAAKSVCGAGHLLWRSAALPVPPTWPWHSLLGPGLERPAALQAIEYGLIDRISTPLDMDTVERKDYEGRLQAQQNAAQRSRRVPAGVCTWLCPIPPFACCTPGGWPNVRRASCTAPDTCRLLQLCTVCM